MPEWLVTVISLVGSTIITTIIGVIVKNTINKEFEKQKELMSLREEKEKSIREKELDKSLSTKLEPINNKLDTINDKLNLDTEGTLSSLRNDILTCYYRCQEKGYRNDYDYQNIHDLYDAYAKLGGNSFIKDVMKRFDKLETKEEFKEIDAHMGTKKKVLNEDKD